MTFNPSDGFQSHDRMSNWNCFVLRSSSNKSQPQGYDLRCKLDNNPTFIETVANSTGSKSPSMSNSPRPPHFSVRLYFCPLFVDFLMAIQQKDGGQKNKWTEKLRRVDAWTL